ncbi:MAG TPA: WecB/TagA/CpsF family glycosyltransferase [Candidatus Acidoferrum sp.]|nr:WecB/TagA/CpsF family glycosyltransferase [Candidatus Acidoferrum sp.]
MDALETPNVAQSVPPASGAYRVLGTRVDALQIPGVIAKMQGWIARRDACRYIAVTGMHGVTEARHDLQLREALADASLVVPDGMPLVWIGRKHGFDLPRRVYGPELMLRFWQETASHRHFFYGGVPGVADALAAKFARQFPAHQIAGTFCPPFRDLTADEDQQICALLNGSRADIVWVGLGTPKQERWMHDHHERLNAPVLIGVGAAFDFHAGKMRSAPVWMGDHGLEWLFRLAQEPRRLSHRYLVRGSEFAALAILELLKQK